MTASFSCAAVPYGQKMISEAVVQSLLAEFVKLKSNTVVTVLLFICYIFEKVEN